MNRVRKFVPNAIVGLLVAVSLEGVGKLHAQMLAGNPAMTKVDQIPLGFFHYAAVVAFVGAFLFVWGFTKLEKVEQEDLDATCDELDSAPSIHS